MESVFRETLIEEVMLTGRRGPLRAGFPIEDGIRCSGCATLLSALNKLPDYHGYVFRRVRLPNDRILEPYLKVGKIVEDKGFISASRGPLGAPPFRGNSRGPGGLYLVIKSRTGKDISRFAASWEKEVVFRPSTKFQVTFSMSKFGGSFFVILEEL